MGRRTRRGQLSPVRTAGAALISELDAGDTPLILFSKAANHLLEFLAKTGASVLSLDWRVDLGAVQKYFDDRPIAVQGNIDPCVLLATPEVVTRAAQEAVKRTAGLGHILNLGHGILPDTPVENALAFVRAGQAAPVAAPKPQEKAAVPAGAGKGPFLQ